MLTFKDFLEVHSRSQSSCRYVEQCKNSDISQCGCYDDYMQEYSLGNKEDKMNKHPAWQWLSNWVGRMAFRHGSVVYDGNKQLDWGQAICRAAYGLDWVNDSDFIRSDNASTVPDYIIEVCKRWEAGEWPAWATAESIVDAICICDKCGWRGTIKECDLNGSSLVCAKCLAALDTSEERLKANEQN